MPKKRARRRSFIRRKRVTPEKKASPEIVEQDQGKNAGEEGDWGFVSGFRAGDFVQGEIAGDFVRDNEVAVSDELFEEFEGVYGTNEQLSEQARAATDGLGKAIGMIESI